MQEDYSEHAASELRDMQRSKNPFGSIFSFARPDENTEVAAIWKEHAELLEALETGYKFGVRYADYEGSATVYFRYRLSAENFVKCGVFTAEPEMFEL